MSVLLRALLVVAVGGVIVWYAARTISGDAQYDQCVQRGQPAQICGYDRCLHQGGSTVSCARFITSQ